MSLRSNAKWNMFSQTFKVLVQVVNIIYLAKIIPPGDYGLMAMALVFINLGVLLRDMGTSAAIIQRKEISHSLINTIFWINSIAGVMLSVLLIIISPLIANVYEQPKLISVLSMLSLAFPLSSCAAAHLALLERESKFKIISFIEISSAVASIIAAVVFANLGFGIYSLIIQSLILNLMSAIQFWYVSSWRPTFKPFINKDEFKLIFGFSANLTLFNFINYFSRNVDSFLIGKYMSAFVLGSYNLAYRIMLFPLQSMTFVTTRSLYPILSKHQDDNKTIAEVYLKCVSIILFITAPLMSGLAYYSAPFVKIVIGTEWYLTADILKWLAPTAIIQSILSTTGPVFMAKGKTNVLFILGIIGAVLQVSAFLIGVQFSVVTFAMCYLIANILNAFPVMITLFKLIDVKVKDFLIIIIPIVFSTFFMLICLNYMSYFFPREEINGLINLFILSGFGLLYYLISSIVFSKNVRNYVYNLIFKV